MMMDDLADPMSAMDLTQPRFDGRKGSIVAGIFRI